MKASELRIGNYIKWSSTGDEEMVYDIQTKGFKNPIINKVSIKDAEGIPLTEEWLLKFGSSVDLLGEGFVYDRFKLIFKRPYKYWYVLDEQSLTYLTKIEFVHEWQNFIFALDNEELSYDRNN